MGNRLGAVVLGTVLIVVVGVFLAFGFILLLGLAAAGLLLGIGVTLYRRLAGRPRPPQHVGPRHGLDPSLEISPPPERTAPSEHKSVVLPLDEG